MRWSIAPRRRRRHDPYRRLSLFAGCTAAQLATAGSLLSDRRVAAGRQLLAEDAGAQGLVLLVEGTAVVLREGEPVALLGAGDVILDGGRRTATVETLTDVRLLVCSLDDAEELRRAVPRLDQVLGPVAGGRVAALDRLSPHPEADLRPLSLEPQR